MLAGVIYDEIGNPLTYRDGMTMTWEGRSLKRLVSNDKTLTFRYDADGFRTKKIINNSGITYQYVNGQLLRERHPNNIVLRYTYDAFGNLATIWYTNTAGASALYYIRTKVNGDVDQIFDANGNLVARYTYDTWGGIVSITDANGAEITDANHIAIVNPIRYRGYYYDVETGLYYLQSRYYDPVTRRFVNEDELLITGNNMTGMNLYAYCGNNPVNCLDPTGKLVIGVGSGANGAAGIDAGYGGGFVFDFKGNIIPSVSKSMGGGLLYFEVNGYIEIYPFVDTVYDLTDEIMYFGASLPVGGIDMLTLIHEGESAVETIKRCDGIRISYGSNVGLDMVHYGKSTSVNLNKNKAHSFETSSSTSNILSPTGINAYSNESKRRSNKALAELIRGPGAW